MSKLTYLHLIIYFSCNIVKIFIIKIEMLLLGSTITDKLLKYMDSHYNFISHSEIYLL